MYARTCYNMDMKLKRTIGLTLALMTATCALSGVKICLPAQADRLSVRAESAPVVFDSSNAALQLPDTYDQYLPLENPSYIAMNGDNIAIADGTSIYIYCKTEDGKFEYTHYVHEPLEEQPTPVSKIQFSDDGEMYFRDGGNQLWHYDLKTHTRDKDPLRDISCQTFLIHGNFLYYVTETPSGPSYFYYVPLDDLQFSRRTELAKYRSASNPRMAYANDTLYCIVNNNTVDAYAYDGTTHQFVGGSKLNKKQHEVDNLEFVCAYGDELFYTVKGANKSLNGIWRTDLDGNAVRANQDAPGEGFSAITSYGDYLYCIQGSTVRQMQVLERATEGEDAETVIPTGYEISCDSSSPHRLAGSGETVRTKDLVAIADTDNNRISLYNRTEGTYTIIPCTDGSNAFTPEHIAINKEEIEVKTNRDVVTTNAIAVSSGNKIYCYTYERHTLKPEENGAGEPTVYTALQKVMGLSYVYGECYYITDYNGYGTLSNPTVSELHFASGLSSPNAITSDIYGGIYVAFGNKVYSFTEEDFRHEGAEGTPVCTLSSESENVYTSLSVDYEGNIWHLTKDGTLYCNNEKQASIDGKNFVYLNKEHDYPTSFALSFEDDELYFNFKNYVVKTDAYALEALPTLNKITAGEAKTKTFELANCDNLFVKVPAGSVGFEIALDALKTGESEYFPYQSYFRSEGSSDGNQTLPRRGVLLYEPQDENGYYVVALYQAQLHTFTANLFKKSRNQLAPDSEYFVEANDTAYITSDVSFCSAPCLFPAPAGERLSTLSDTLLARGTKIRVLGYAEGEDRVYAYVEATNEAKSVQRGFVPRSYLTKNDPLGVAQQDYFLGYLKADAGIKLVSADGTELEITEKTQAKLFKNEDGTYTAVVVKDGVTYTGIVTAENISRGETDAMRISLIVILSVLALVIICGYVFLMFPRKKKKK